MTFTHTITARQAISGAERREAEAILDACRAEGLSLKLDLDVLGERDGEIRALVCHEDGALAGFCTLDPGRDLELCGAVHPDRRRRGIGRALLTRALDEARRCGRERALVICEERSSGGVALLSAAGATRAFGEHRMALTGLVRAEPPLATLEVARATLDDVGGVARVIARTMDDDETGLLTKIAAELDAPGQRFYFGRIDGAVVASLKVVFGRDRAYVYGFGVLPEHRRRGLGRQLLTGVIDALAAEGHTRVALEVETHNHAAVSLYLAMGFTITTTYGYHALPTA